MRVLIIKTSSMGDIIHTLPALTDAGNAFSNITFDWVVEENFSEIPSWHPLVKKIIPVALRRWRKHFFSSTTWKEFFIFYKKLRENRYDLIIDAQGLVKSTFLTYLAKGTRCGFDRASAREAVASLFYQRTFCVSKKQHAIRRLRSLFSQALSYSLPTTTPQYGIHRQTFLSAEKKEKYILFLHGTTWKTKWWPEDYWIALSKKVIAAGLHIKLPWGNTTEKERAERIASHSTHAEILPRLDLSAMAKIIANAEAIVSVDTGFCHLAAALDVPTISIYGATDPQLTGAQGSSQLHMTSSYFCSPCLKKTCQFNTDNPPCFQEISPDKVWEKLSLTMSDIAKRNHFLID